MRESFTCRVLVYALIWSQITFAANYSQVRKTAPVGVARIGEFSSKAAEAYPFLEKRLQRWLENSLSYSAIVQPVEVSFSKDEISIEQNRLQLANAVENLLSNVYGASKDSKQSNLVSQVQKARQKVNLVSRFGPLLQRSYMVEAAYNWKIGETEKSKKLIASAYKLHPEGVVENLSDWDAKKTGSFPMEVFEAFVSRYLTTKVRACQIQVTAEPSSAAVKVNGFDFGTKRKFAFVTGGLYYLNVDARGYSQEESLIRCERQGIQRIKLHLKNRKSEMGTTLTEVGKKAGVRSLFLVESKESQFKIYLYTPQVSLDEVPLSRSITVAEVMAHPTDSTLPTASDAVQDVFQKHHFGQNLSVAMNPQPHPLLMPRNSTQQSLDAQRWYNHWVVWAIAGGIVTGAAITYFVSRGDSSVGSQTPRGR